MPLGAPWKLTSLPVVVGGSFGLLLLLGTLQYRWVGQVSDAERMQMRAGAKARVEALTRDFDREVTRAFLGLQMDPETLRERAFDRYAERYEFWQRRAAHPALVKDVFLVEKGPGDAFRLSRFEPSGRTFEPAEWPATLAAVRTRIEQFGRDKAPERVLRRGPADLISEDGPSLLMPVPSFVPSPRPSNSPAFGLFQLSAVTLVVLDLDYIQHELLPALAERHFGSGGVLDYNLVAVRQADAGSVVWRSNADAPVAPTGDAAAGMLELRFEAADAEDLLTFSERPSAEGASRRALALRGNHLRRFGLGAPRTGPRGGPRGDTSDSGHWRLVATHRAGSVDQVVAAARDRNLAVSFGILALLALSTALVVASSQRARWLADRQMEFVAGVSHELRTPVAVICSAAENLADGLVHEPAQVRRYGTVLRDEGRRLAEMVEQVLEFAGAYWGRRSYGSESVEVGRVVNEALEACGAAIREAGMTVALELPADLPAVRGDAGALRRAVQNLVMNALKYGGEERWLGVRASTAEEHSRPEVRIEVEDKGHGIPPGELGHVFEAFFRGREALVAQTRGFGLGLSLVKRVAEAHGGRVSVASVPGRGSLFTLHLPAAPLPAGAPEPTHGIAHPAR
jgi:signal transduction histidine kinase